MQGLCQASWLGFLSLNSRFAFDQMLRNVIEESVLNLMCGEVSGAETNRKKPTPKRLANLREYLSEPNLNLL